MSFLNNNGTSLVGIVDITAHSISIFQENENEEPENIVGIFIPKSDISIAEPYDVIIGEIGIMLFLCTSLLVILMTQKLVV